MSLLQRTSVFLFACLVCACASAGGAQKSASTSVLVALCNYKSGERFELASESNTKRVDYYSETRKEAVRKVQSDEIMSAFVGELGKAGFAQHAQAGPAPKVASGDVVRWGLEIQDGEQKSHWLVGSGTQGAELKTFQDCRDTFLQLYNITVSYQAVENKSGKQYFDQGQSVSGKPAAKKP